MKKLMLPFFLLMVQYSFGQQVFQLTPPLLKYQSIFYDNKALLEIKFDQPGAEVRYTMNGNEPTEKDLLYTKPVVISGKRIRVKAKSIGKGFLPSGTATVEFFKTGKAIRKIEFSTPNPKYPGNGVGTLHDNIGGQMDLSSGTWLGYDTDTVTVTIQLKEKGSIKGVLVDILQNESNWIFLPEQVLLYYYDDTRNAYVPAGKEVFSSERPAPKQCSAQELIPNQKIHTDNLKLVFCPVKKIPGWHPGKDNHAWLFIDEIKVY
ncbi:chitobiase/beta-hexosaminidase C-terminal domain-containing protein [Chitinophagaceae bacterium LB-8]|uniref:Chitobiase/beta-hexosaminidase C-terminal domain-containing protein n=1 Tax=Paraflavisolibacter caeni TaxID=2982496 RepID=A0A9X3BA53_9BACT|nr:FN3 associated domain-containing protein [Paraflavisolibacter caeni]MCU7552201.1 chitobiase/beta-hexosaminidase C-terminal domain-containing protein [Paraflavisolibacter caeni]